MKRTDLLPFHFFLVLLFSFSLVPVSGQTCLPGGITFTSQAEIDNFPVNYPGCTQIVGGVTISGVGTITNLNGLSGVTSIGGNVTLNALGSLGSLSGLGSLTTIGGYLRITECDMLTNLTGLGNLTSIGGDYLWIEGNDALTSLSALSSLTSLSTAPGGSVLEVDNNDQLTSLSGLNNIAHTTIGTLQLTNSSLLSICDVASVCNFLNAYGGAGATISANTTGCNNVMEVLTACVPVCGDGVVEGSEGCDDGNMVNNDGCTGCTVDPGWSCSGSPSVCMEVCGNGIITPSEGCDDNNLVNGDGCDATCQVEPGWACCGQPSVCSMPATNFTFTGTGSWCDAARWSPSIPPDCMLSGTTITINGTCNLDCAFVTLPAGVTLNVANVASSLTLDLAGVLIVNGGSITNNGILLLNNLSGMGNSYLSVQSGTLTNHHNLVLHSNTFMDISGTFQNNNLLYNEGGAITFQPGSTINSHTTNNSGSLLNFSPNFTITNTFTNQSAGFLTNATYGGGGPGSQITIQAGATFNNAGNVQNSGQIQNCGAFNNSGTVSSLFGTFFNCIGSSVQILAGGLITCTDFVGHSLFYNAGDVFPGCSPGTMTVTGDFINQATGELNIELGGTMAGTDYDQLIVTDSASLAGTLTVTLVNGFVPAPGNTFTVMTYARRTGTFSTVNLPCALSWTLSYSPTSVTLTFVPATEICNGLDDDCNGSPESAANNWTGSGDGINWSDPANWSDGFVPLTCQDVVIPAGQNVTVPAGFTAVGKTLTVPVATQLTVQSTGLLLIQN